MARPAPSQPLEQLGLQDVEAERMKRKGQDGAREGCEPSDGAEQVRAFTKGHTQQVVPTQHRNAGKPRFQVAHKAP